MVAVPGRYSVTYLLLGESSLVVVDVGSVADLLGIRRAIAWLGRQESEVRGVLPTHLHMDHCMGIERLATSIGAPVLLGSVAHEAVAGRRVLRFPSRLRLLRSIPTYFFQGAPRPPLAELPRGFEFGFPWSKNRFCAPVGPPLADGAELPGVGGWRVLHTPGHADDAICLHHPRAGFLVTGDTVRNFFGGEWNQLVADPGQYRGTQARLRAREVDTIFPGHGPVVEGPQALRRIKQLPFYLP